MNRRRYPPNASMRREKEAEASDEAAFQQNVAGPMLGFDQPELETEPGPPKCREVGRIAQGNCFTYIFTALEPIRCHDCKREIQAGEEFSAVFFKPATAAYFAGCATCRTIERKKPMKKFPRTPGIRSGSI
jgi:hypothetical protein